MKLHKGIKVVADTGRVFTVHHYFYSVKRANLFLSINRDYGVLCIRGKRIYMAKLTDAGVPYGKA